MRKPADDQSVTVSLRKAALIPLIAGSLSGLVAMQGAGAQSGHQRTTKRHPAIPSTSAFVARSTTSSMTAPNTLPGSSGSEGSGNLAVEVPVLPRLEALPGLCDAFLNSDAQDKQGTSFQVLVGATGGNAAATDAWCRNYLSDSRHSNSARSDVGLVVTTRTPSVDP